MKTIKIAIKNLSQCAEILALRPVNQMFVSRYRTAMRNGDEFPPPIVDQDHSIVSGNHRYESYLYEYGEDHVIEVIVRNYKDEAERIADAVRENNKHGNPLDGVSRKRISLRLAQLGWEPERIAQLLGIPCRSVERIGNEIVFLRGVKEPQPIKRNLKHIAGATVRKEDYAEHIQSDIGVNCAFLAKQLARHIRCGWVNMDDPETAAAIGELKEAIETL
jgi:hypothetical protein